MILNSQSCCLHYFSAGNTGIYHHTMYMLWIKGSIPSREAFYWDLYFPARYLSLPICTVIVHVCLIFTTKIISLNIQLCVPKVLFIVIIIITLYYWNKWNEKTQDSWCLGQHSLCCTTNRKDGKIFLSY